MKLDLTDKETKAILTKIKKQLPRSLDVAISDLTDRIAENWMKENKELIEDTFSKAITEEVWPIVLKNLTDDYKRNAYLQL